MTENYDAVFSIVAFVGIIAIFYGPWQELCADYCRQIIFEEREKLFDLAADGKLNFKSDQYRRVRSYLEKTIRFAHELTLFTFVLHQLPTKGEDRADKRPSMKAIVASIEDKATRDQVDMIVRKSARALVISMGARSLLVLFGVLLSAPAQIFPMLASRISGKLKRVERAVQSEVEHAQP